jgi:hypothetical protein
MVQHGFVLLNNVEFNLVECVIGLGEEYGDFAYLNEKKALIQEGCDT